MTSVVGMLESLLSISLSPAVDCNSVDNESEAFGTSSPAEPIQRHQH
jgi:hypothetical protein